MEKWRRQIVGLIQDWKLAKWAGQKHGHMEKEWGTLARGTEGVNLGSWPDREAKGPDGSPGPDFWRTPIHVGGCGGQLDPREMMGSGENGLAPFP